MEKAKLLVLFASCLDEGIIIRCLYSLQVNLHAPDNTKSIHLMYVYHHPTQLPTTMRLKALTSILLCIFHSGKKTLMAMRIEFKCSMNKRHHIIIITHPFFMFPCEFRNFLGRLQLS